MGQKGGKEEGKKKRERDKLMSLFIYFFAACGLSLVAVSRADSLLQCSGFSSPRLLLLQYTGSR